MGFRGSRLGIPPKRRERVTGEKKKSVGGLDDTPEQEGKQHRWDLTLQRYYITQNERNTTKAKAYHLAGEPSQRAFKAGHIGLPSQVLPRILEISGLPKSSLFPVSDPKLPQHSPAGE